MPLKDRDYVQCWLFISRNISFLLLKTMREFLQQQKLIYLMNCGKNQVPSIRSNTDISMKSVQNCFLFPVLSCGQVVGIQDCAYSAARENLCAGAKKHSCLQKPGRGVTSPRLPLCIYSAPAAKSNDQCHAENLKPWRGSSAGFAKDGKICKSACAQVEQCDCPG